MGRRGKWKDGKGRKGKKGKEGRKGNHNRHISSPVGAEEPPKNRDIYHILRLWSPMPTHFSIRANINILEFTQFLRLHANFFLDRFIVSPSRSKIFQILSYFQNSRYAVAPPSVVETKFNLFSPNDTEIISIFQRLHGEVAFTIFVVQSVKEKEKNKNIEHFRSRYCGTFNPTNCGVMIDSPYHACTSEICSHPTIILPLGTLKIWEKMHCLNLPPPRNSVSPWANPFKF